MSTLTLVRNIPVFQKHIVRLFEVHTKLWFKCSTGSFPKIGLYQAFTKMNQTFSIFLVEKVFL